MPLTEADRARIEAYIDAMKEAMEAIPEFDLDKVCAAREAVAKAHSISQDVFQAYSNEGLTEKPLRLSHSVFLKPDAPWGLAVYRISYSDDAAWDRILSGLRRDIEESFIYREAQLDFSSRHDLVVMDDQSEFEGAGLGEIREHFNNWSLDELRRNCRADREPPSKDGDPRWLAEPRYNFFLLVDDICLESAEKMSNPVIKLVNRQWTPYSESDLEELEEDEDKEDEKLDWEGGETNSELEDVGWIYVYTHEYIDVQEELWEDDNWVDLYVRPPFMRFENTFDEAPGFWRRSAASAHAQLE